MKRTRPTSGDEDDERAPPPPVGLVRCSSSSSGSMMASMLEWVERNGGRYLDMESKDRRLDFRLCSNTEAGDGTLGCFSSSTHDYKIGDVFFTVPQRLIFGVHQCTATPLALSLRNAAKQDPTLVTSELLIWVHMIQSLSDPLSFFHPYFASLDRVSPSPLSWPGELQTALEGTPLHSALQDVRASLTKHCELLRAAGLDDSVYNYESLVWARGHYLARRYPGKYGLDESIVDGRDGRESGLESLGVLVPVLDLINHDAEEEWLHFEVKDNELLIICNHPRPRGTQLFSNYGSLSNERLLYAYGFCLQNNPCDTVTLRLMASVAGPEPCSRDLGTFYIERGGFSGVPEALWRTLSIMAGNDEQEEVESNGGEAAAFEVSTDEIEALLSFCRRKLTALADTDVNVDKVLAQKDNALASYCSFYRQGQREILQELIHDLAKSLEEAVEEEEGEESDGEN